MDTNDITELDVLLHRDGKWRALEGCYWPAMLRLLRAHGLDPTPYEAPTEGDIAFIDAGATTALVTCLEDTYDDIPNEGLWEFHRNNPARVPDPYTTPPHEYFSGAGISYLVELIDFGGTGGFSIELTEPETE